VIDDRPQSKLFEAFSRELLRDGMCVRFEARGASMSPAIRDGEVVHVERVDLANLRAGDIVLAKAEHGFRLHRLVVADTERDVFITRGDCGVEDDPAFGGEAILGIAVDKEVRVGRRMVRAKLTGAGGNLVRCVARAGTILKKLLKAGRGAGFRRATSSKVLRKAPRTLVGLTGLILWLLAATQASAQVTVDASTSGSAVITGPGGTVNFNHTTTATANRLLLVGVSLNLTNSNTSGVVGVTYNGTALNFVGAHNDAGNTRRVEMWYVLNPVSGANLPIVVTVNVPTAAATVGVVAGATTFTGVDQTVPLSAFVSADGAAAFNSQLDVPSVVNGMVFDTLAIGGNRTVVVPAPQVQQWNARIGVVAPPDVRGTASTRAGAPSVPISETFSGAQNWSLGAVSINPTTADITVTTSVVSAVFVGQNTTYNITVTNNGPSPANAVTLTDTLAPAGLTLVSVTPSAGTTCVGTGPINCILPTPLNGGASATVAVVVTASVAGQYPNTATIADSGTPPDPNIGNNSFTAVATVQSAACAAAASGGNAVGLTGVINTYYPGTANVAAGATSIPVGAPTGAGTPIANGDLLLVIQMQDATINTGNSVSYGNGSTGAGFTLLNQSGNFEFVTATGAVAAGAVPVSGAGAGGGLVFNYNSAVAGATNGQSTYQVIRVPQYATASLGAALTASPWNGSTGGVLVLDVAGALTLGGQTVNVNALGFRGGAGMQLSGNGGGSNTDFRQVAPTAYGGTPVAGFDAPKGEGIAGTPLWVESGLTFVKTNTDYPSGTAGTDGSMARGAPGNGGGGGTDADPAGNDQNAGGGGGGNGGSGGFGGDSWNTNLSTGGEGGALFPATVNRVVMGGGGGGGTRNNSNGDNQASGGAAGGGIIIIRAGSLTGTATVTANGAPAYNGTLNDAGGGGGAGGSIVILSAGGGEGGLTVQAQGGRGGDAWDAQAFSLANRHGPGGGGGGGAVILSGAGASISVGGGASGTTLNPGVSYGATAGNAGTSVTNASITQTSGTQSGADCVPDMTLGKSHLGNFTRGSAASYTIPVQNLSPFGPTSGTVTINDTLPVGVTPTSASGAGWSCSVVSQTVSCVRADSLAGSSSYPSITINVGVAQTAPATVTNTAMVSGGGEINLANDSATDVANVVSTADMSVTDAASPNPVAAGNNITYTQVVTNSGPSAADNATVVAAIPANTGFVSLTAPAGWSCITPAIGATGNVVCSNSNLAGGTAGTFTLVVKVNSGTANGTVITGTVTVGSSASDPNSANNTASASTIVGATAQADLSVTNAASPKPVVAGNNITYTQVVTNTGSVAATGPATFAEATPANTTFVSLTPPAGWTCLAPPPVSCTNPSVAVGSSGTFTVVYTVNAGTASGTIISDTATVGATNDAFAGDNNATATDVVATAGQADLALGTAATPPTVLAGNNITYTQTVTNNGPAAASTVSFTEPVPTNTTFVSVSAPAGWTCTVTASVTCTNPSVAAATSADIIVVVNVAPTVAAGTITANSSLSSSVTTDPNAANNSTVVTTNINVACDLTVTNSGVPNPVAAGSNITYTQTVTNYGPSNCSTATFNELTPLNTTWVSVVVVTAGGGTWTCPNSAPVSCTNPSVPPGSTGTITAVYNVNAGTAAGTIITDTATAATPTRDTNLADNSATVNIAVAGAGQADLSVTNVASPNPVNAGSNITYTQVVTNGGPASAANITLTDALPSNTTFVSLTGPAGWVCSGVTFTCTNATLAASGTATFTFVVKVNATTASGTTITDTVSVASASTSDPNLANNSASASVQVGTSADLSITNSPSPVPVQANNNITYTQIVSNAGPSNTGAITLTEALPANTTAQSLTGPAGWTCILGTLTCTNSTLAAGGNATFTYVVKVNAGTAAGTAINETASVSSTTTDPNSANNSATAADVVALGTQADLVTTNSAAPSSVAAGSNVTYTQSVTNLGPAAATTVTFTQSTPPNTNFQSITIPVGWTCPTLPPVGGTGPITCNDSSNLAVNATANFTVVLQVNPGTPSGTTIAETATASATNIVPGLTTNSATATVIVANANSADVAITKTATPNPVAQGDILTYTLSVINNGPASATNVTVADTLPSAVTYLSVVTTTGTCSEAGGTVTCLLGTMANAATATVTVVTLAGTPGIVSNTATVTADQTDPNLTNNSSTQTETITAPTSVQLQFFKAAAGLDKNGANRIVLQWRTGGEAHNLGFNVYREVNGNRVRLNPSLIAGSALLMRGALPKHSGKTYNWIDPSAGADGGEYWLEDVDLGGTRTMHGPVSAASANLDGDSAATQALTFSQLSQARPAAQSGDESHPVEAVVQEFVPSSSQIQKQFELAAHPAVKILVRHEGWYHVMQPDLVKAGLDPNVDPASLRLFAEAVEEPLQITGATAGRGGFGPQAAVNFYGTGIDTVYSGTRVYWLVAGEGTGARIRRLEASKGSNLPPSSFPSTVELRQRTTYFAALLTPDGDNFFGALVSPTPVEQVLHVPHLDQTSTQPARIEVVLQGVIVGVPHDVTVALNGTPLGDVTFTGQVKGRFQVNVPPGVLLNWNNTVTLTSQNGPYDISLVNYIRIVYPHSYVADSDELKFSGRAGDEVKVAGFVAAPAALLDITDPDRPVELTPQIILQNGKYEIDVQVPWATTNPAAPIRHTLLAVADDRLATTAAVRPNHPSHWHSPQAGAEIAMVTYEDFAGALTPLVRSHQAEGKSSAVVPINDLYDEFNSGERSPFAIRQFLQSATSNWKTAPKYLLLNGRASIDPRNYLGFGHLDLVPTKIVPTPILMTSSDDWFSDFTDSGMPTVATGRLPVSTADEANTVVGKVVAYEGQSTNGAWTAQALMVADRDDTTDTFTLDSQTVQAQLPSAMQVTDVFTTTVGVDAARQQIIDGINSGQLLVNYLGHGSEEQWSGSDIFDTTTVTSLTNGSELPVFLIMDCLNGFFQDVYQQPLGVTLLLAPNGGAVAVLASTGLNQPVPQAKLDKLVVQQAMNPARPALGEAILKAKSFIGDPSVRRTYVLFGDPAMRLKAPGAVQ
jgi:uncharacterized repeat protein (TIGR01451 family)